MSKTIERQCPICGRTYIANIGRLKWKRETTCSRECSYELRTGKAIKKQLLTCPVCGKQFEAIPSRIKRAKYTPVCSRACLYKGREIGIIKHEVKEPYQITEKGKEAWRKAAKKRKGQLRKPPVEFTCETCGKKVTIPRGKISPSRKFRFCSNECANIGNTGENNPSWRGGYEPYYGPNWRRQRRKARKRDKHTCQSCGITEGKLGRELDVHHIQRFADFSDYRKANHPSNLVSLCHSCHMKAG